MKTMTAFRGPIGIVLVALAVSMAGCTSTSPLPWDPLDGAFVQVRLPDSLDGEQLTDITHLVQDSFAGFAPLFPEPGLFCPRIEQNTVTLLKFCGRDSGGFPQVMVCTVDETVFYERVLVRGDGEIRGRECVATRRDYSNEDCGPCGDDSWGDEH